VPPCSHGAPFAHVPQLIDRDAPQLSVTSIVPQTRAPQRSTASSPADFGVHASPASTAFPASAALPASEGTVASAPLAASLAVDASCNEASAAPSAPGPFVSGPRSSGNPVKSQPAVAIAPIATATIHRVRIAQKLPRTPR
jgi:hypothetical protein